MSNKNIEYQPYVTHKYLLPVVVVMTISALIFTGYCLAIGENKATIFALILSICGCIFTRFFYDTSRIVVLAGFEEIQIIGDRGNSNLCIPWKSILYIYYSSNYRGFRFLILSPVALDQMQVKRLVVRGGLSKLYFDGIIVIGIDNRESAKNLEHLISTKMGGQGDGLREPF